MSARLSSSHPDFHASLAAFMAQRDAHAPDVADTVREILARVKHEGDEAVIALTGQFDHISLSSNTMRFSKEDIERHAKACDPTVTAALQFAAQRIRSYHQAQMPQDYHTIDGAGVTLGWHWNALSAVGLYVPGGQASYPSSVLMNAIPAKVAGVARIAMVVPTPNGDVNPAILAAAQIAGIDEIYRIGGAQAVGALAYGTQSIAAVDKIVGPGNAYVAEAKRQVFGTVGIDMIAGPSEILVVADNENNPDWIAADLLSQAEHDADAQSILITDDMAFGEMVAVSVEAILRELPREAIARKSWQQHGAIITVKHLSEAPAIINLLAPEHLELAIADPELLLSEIHHAGAIFLGRYSPEAIGDYLAGPSHVLPTSRTARFSSGLGVTDFMKRTSLIGMNKQAFFQIAPAAAVLADSEGLGAHALSVRLRMK